MSRTGLTFAALYLAATAACAVAGLLHQGDPKGQFVLLQMPLLFLVPIAHQSFLSHLSWLEAYAITIPVTAAALYVAGWAIARVLTAH